jgi:hypothetical protein
MNKDLELEILRNLLFKIANASISRDTDKLSLIIESIRYDYCYNQRNSNCIESVDDIEKKRIKSLLNLQKL